MNFHEFYELVGCLFFSFVALVGLGVHMYAKLSYKIDELAIKMPKHAAFPDDWVEMLTLTQNVSEYKSFIVELFPDFEPFHVEEAIIHLLHDKSEKIKNLPYLKRFYNASSTSKFVKIFESHSSYFEMFGYNEESIKAAAKVAYNLSTNLD